MSKKRFDKEIITRMFPWTETRPMIRHVKGQNLIGAEIGVRFGHNALNILRTKDIEKLYLIDPYTEYLTVGGRKFNSKDENAYLKARDNLKKYRDKVVFMTEKSSDAYLGIMEELDFCYIDGLHTYEGVQQDIDLYYPLIKKGGLLGGDDFSIKFQGLCLAVIEFVSKHHLILHGDGTDWWVQK